VDDVISATALSYRGRAATPHCAGFYPAFCCTSGQGQPPDSRVIKMHQWRKRV